MRFPYGETNFEKIRSEGYFYVDKTRYIELLENLQASHVVMLRSRRFGKTLFANMLGYYYDQLHADKFDALLVIADQRMYKVKHKDKDGYLLE